MNEADATGGQTDRTALTCQELVEVITGYVEGTLPDDDRARFEAHLEACEGCRTYLDQMRLTIEAIGSLRAESLDPRAQEELVRTFRGWKDR